MITVSEKFRKLAQDNGREVWCRITVGSEEFLDDRITDMTFDDVIHPDWFTVGTTCSNRLHFTARYSGELSSGAEVRAQLRRQGVVSAWRVLYQPKVRPRKICQRDRL